MSTDSRNNQAYLNRLTSVVEANLSDESFGVSELAKEMGMSRSQLYVKVKSNTGKSASQFIREIRLNKALELLLQTDLHVSEIAYQVGFSSPTYFNNCFRRYFGYPPGEAKQHPVVTPVETQKPGLVELKKKTDYFIKKNGIVAVAFIIIFGSIFIWYKYSINKRPDINREKSIIVLPFTNLSSEENNRYFADGISEDVLNQLTKIKGFKVVSRTSAEQFRESRLSAPEIANKINVNYILTGSVRRQGNNVRISVRLVDARKDLHLWSENYDRQLEDIFPIQNNIAQNVANQLQTILSPAEIKQIEKLHPINAEAYDSYLMGQYLCLRRDSLSIQKGIDYFEKAIEIDSAYTLAYAGLADGYYALAFMGHVDTDKGYKMAYRAAEKALEMDSTLAETYAVLGVVSIFGYWEYEKARSFFEKAIKLDSNCIVAHLYYSGFLEIVGEPEKALEQINKAIEQEPYYHMSYVVKGNIYRNEKKYIESINSYERCLELNPEYRFAYFQNFLNYLDLNDEALAVQTLQQYFSFFPEGQEYINELKPVYETTGINGVLKLYIEVIREERLSGLNLILSRIYSRLDMMEETLDCLEKACYQKECDCPRYLRYPEYERLHTNPRFQVLIDTMNLRSYFAKTIN
ncbi:FlgO family outer membrane protein [uncultured Draconibacterium sp.]|uniref:FlgO family outer membrane protein n=1 Tax=uncultured Draconibacterium sp. TaxID=1573823 RepID=UPI002AA6C049|nr:FlgO family outer membrane protein [uncultured Draconibacterium sp.]